MSDPIEGLTIDQFSGASDRHGDLLPQRHFGRSAEKVTILGVGGFHIAQAGSERAAQEIIDSAIAQGIRFFDTAPSYHEGRAEHRYGLTLPKYRDDIFLLTKSKARSAAELTAEFESSMARMKTDRIDALLMHAIASEDDADDRIENKVWDAMFKLKEQGKVRYLGFSGHVSTAANLKVLERVGDQLDVTLMPINAVDPSNSTSYVNQVLPVMQAAGVASLAMKTVAGGGFINKMVKVNGQQQGSPIPSQITLDQAFEFVLSQPVACWVSGMDKPELVAKNAQLARDFKGMTQASRDEIIAQVAAFKDNAGVEWYRRWRRS